VVAWLAVLRHALARASLFVPEEAGCAHLHPLALASAGLIVPELVGGTVLSVGALATAALVVPRLSLWTPIFLRANTAALLKVEVEGLDAFDSLLADALAKRCIPDKRPLTQRLHYRDAGNCCCFNYSLVGFAKDQFFICFGKLKVFISLDRFG